LDPGSETYLVTLYDLRDFVNLDVISVGEPNTGS